MLTLDQAVVPTEGFLRYNEFGGAIVRQSDLSSWSRCNLQKWYGDRARHDAEAQQPAVLSATMFGTVVHYALMNLERAIHYGEEGAVERAVSTFRHYWHPDNITQIEGGARVTEWLPRQTWNGLLERGEVSIRSYAEMLAASDDRLLALEYQFAVPVHVNGRTHTLTGTIDRLSLARHYRKPYILVSDFKTGKQPTYLRYNMQGTAYGYATTQPEFWVGPGEGLWSGELETFGEDFLNEWGAFFESWGYSLIEGGDKPLASRRFRWINMQEVKYADGGWRTASDYTRLHLAIDAYVRANEAGVFMPTTTGEVCMYCDFRRSCAGVGVAEEGVGAP